MCVLCVRAKCTPPSGTSASWKKMCPALSGSVKTRHPQVRCSYRSATQASTCRHWQLKDKRKGTPSFNWGSPMRLVYATPVGPLSATSLHTHNTQADEANVELNCNFSAGLVEGKLMLVVEVHILKQLEEGTPLIRLVEETAADEEDALTQTQDVAPPTQIPSPQRSSPSWNPRCTPRADRPVATQKEVTAPVSLYAPLRLRFFERYVCIRFCSPRPWTSRRNQPTTRRPLCVWIV